jgi:hypothetical protein
MRTIMSSINSLGGVAAPTTKPARERLTASDKLVVAFASRQVACGRRCGAELPLVGRAERFLASRLI